MSFFALSTASGRTAILCFDAPDHFRQRLCYALSSNSQSLDDPDIYQLHVYLVEELLHLYDRSVWAIRDFVRDVEKASSIECRRSTTGRSSQVQHHSITRRAEADFHMLHDIARHAIHVTETLDVAAETMIGMIRQYTLRSHDRSSQDAHKNITFTRTLQFFQFQLQTFKSLKARSDSNLARLQNEINLVRYPLMQRLP